MLHYATLYHLGILCGLFLENKLEFLFSYLSIKLKFAECQITQLVNLYGVGVLTGIGFTMSLFVGNLAFADNYNT